MFLDLKRSTQLAEHLGHEQYYEFINDFIEDVSEAVLRTWGHIYQYVGDEIVVYWPWNKRLNSMDCYFQIWERLQAHRQRYIDRFGQYPEFRVGLHGGEVLIGEIGLYKKDILYIGDVLNATSRIEQLCRDLKVGLLLSEDVLVNLSLPDNYQLKNMGSYRLRGKTNPKQLFTLVKTNSPSSL